jgi:hypothetical protein
MIPAWITLLRRPFDRSREHFVSVDVHRLSDPRNYEMLTPMPHQYHLAKGPAGLVAIPSKETPQDRDLSDSSEDMDSFEKEPQYTPIRSASVNYSYPRPPSSSASDTQRTPGRIREDREILPSPAEEVWPSPARDRANSPSTGRKVGWKGSVETLRSGSALGIERPSPILERERSGSALARERDAAPRYPHARTAPVAPLRPSNSRADADWDPRSTFARGNRPGGALTPDPGAGARPSRFSPEPEPAHIRIARSERPA